MIRMLCTFIMVCVLLTLTVLCLAASKAPAGVHPIVDATDQGQLFGGAINGKWVGEDVMQKKIKGGETYRLYSFNKYLGTGIGGTPEKSELSGDSLYLRITPAPKVKIDEKCTIGISGNWNALTRVPRDENVHQQVYTKAVHDMLVSKGLAEAPVNITRIVRVDLDGDGKDEVLISATTPRKGYADWSHKDRQPRKGDYSFVMLRKLVKGTVKTMMLDGEFYPSEKNLSGEAYRYTIDAVLDANGDGVMEVITGYRNLASGRRIIDITGSKAKSVLSADQDV